MNQQRIYLNDGWRFGETGSDKTELVRLPHSTVVTPFHYFDEEIYQKNTIYERTIVPEEEWKDMHVLLTVGGAAHQSQVVINGTELGLHNCGYTAYTVDLAPYLIWGRENTLQIQVNSSEKLNQPPFGNVIDYMTYGGLYREVYLDIKPKGYIRDVFYMTEKLEDVGELANAHWTCLVEVEKSDESERSIRQFLKNEEGM